VSIPGISRRPESDPPDAAPASSWFRRAGETEAGPSGDLWSLPQDALQQDAAAPSAEEKLLATWIGALGQGDSSQEPRDAAMIPVGPDVPHPPDDAALTVDPPPRLPNPAERRRGPIMITALLSLAIGVLIGVTVPSLLGRLRSDANQGSVIGGGGTNTPTGVTPDGRVVLQGVSADCPLILLKPRVDGATTGVAGTCFDVG
jgi:hypothetical protein